MTVPRMADLRNIYSAQDAEAAGFEAFVGIGRAGFDRATLVEAIAVAS
jgi:UDPglucose 6-dehydrogenase